MNRQLPTGIIQHDSDRLTLWLPRKRPHTGVSAELHQSLPLYIPFQPSHSTTKREVPCSRNADVTASRYGSESLTRPKSSNYGRRTGERNTSWLMERWIGYRRGWWRMRRKWNDWLPIRCERLTKVGKPKTRDKDGWTSTSYKKVVKLPIAEFPIARTRMVSNDWRYKRIRGAIEKGKKEIAGLNNDFVRDRGLSEMREASWGDKWKQHEVFF